MVVVIEERCVGRPPTLEVFSRFHAERGNEQKHRVASPRRDQG